ncbi:MAG TPA: 30S ribosomal protein S1 [Nitrospirota bacterium]|nr:30S ribosomal protein S1 [Nitrospirota bacterium]
MGDHRDDFEHEENNAAAGQETEFEQLYNQSLKQFKSGTVVRGRVLQIRNDFVMLDVGYKSDGIIPVDQFTIEELKTIKPGDELEVLLEQAEDSNGNIMLSRDKAKKLQVWDDLNKAYDTGAVIKGKVTAAIKGGLSVDIGGVTAFLPGSQIDIKPVHALGQYVGRTLDLKIIKMNSGRGNIVLSRRVILEQQQNEKKEATLSSLVEGQIVSGTVKNITDYGAFIDLGGIDGLMHITDISWGRINHPSEAVKVGERLDVVVLKYDREKQKVSLGMKQKTADPWLSVGEKYPVHSRVKGKVVSLAEYGAFVELEQGVEGLVHVSEMSWTAKIKHPSKVLAVGDTIEASVLSVDPASKRISLGLKQLTPNPWSTIGERYPVGSHVEGKVKTITDFGAFLGIEEGIDGLIHVSDLSWTKHIRHPSEMLKKGQQTKAVVLAIDPAKERISLGLKQLEPDPWEKAIPDRYKVGQDEKVKVSKKADFGLFVELELGIEGLIPTSEIPKDSADNKEGDEITARVIKVDKGDRKIALSIKAYIKGQDRSSLRDYMNQQQKPDTTIGALLKERS